MILTSIFSLFKVTSKLKKKKATTKTWKLPLCFCSVSLNNHSHDYLFISLFIKFLMSPQQMPDSLGTQQRTKVTKVPAVMEWCLHSSVEGTQYTNK